MPVTSVICLHSMVHYLMLLKLKEGLPTDSVDQIMVEARIRLLKIPGVMNLSCGKRIDAQSTPHDLFIAWECENLSKLRSIIEHPVFLGFDQQVLEPSVGGQLDFHFETEPNKDVRYL